MHKITIHLNEPQATHLMVTSNRYRMTAESYIRRLINIDKKRKLVEIENLKKKKNGKK